jgi:hypothetical protein
MAYPEVSLNRMAQRFYEVASEGGIIFPNMTSKPVIVEALRAALDGEAMEQEHEVPDQYQAVCGSWNCLAPECRPKGL